MFCIGAVIPSQYSVGFAAPIFSNNKNIVKDNWFYCSCDSNEKIDSFIRGSGAYDIIIYCKPTEIKTYNIGQIAPTVFVYDLNNNKQILIGDQSEVIEALINVSKNNRASLESRCKAIRYVGINNFPKKFIQDIYRKHYEELCKKSILFAKDWKRRMRNEGIDIDQYEPMKGPIPRRLPTIHSLLPNTKPCAISVRRYGSIRLAVRSNQKTRNSKRRHDHLMKMRKITIKRANYDNRDDNGSDYYI